MASPRGFGVVCGGLWPWWKLRCRFFGEGCWGFPLGPVRCLVVLSSRCRFVSSSLLFSPSPLSPPPLPLLPGATLAQGHCPAPLGPWPLGLGSLPLLQPLMIWRHSLAFAKLRCRAGPGLSLPLGGAAVFKVPFGVSLPCTSFGPNLRLGSGSSGRGSSAKALSFS